VVEHAIRVSTQLGEARDRAREAQLEAAQHEAEAADADEAARIIDNLLGAPSA
jgi:hypothetical protein